MEIALKDYGTREAWLASRTTALGASEVAALFMAPDGSCLSPYTTPFKLWLEKTGQQEPEELTGDHIELGNRLEPVIAEIYAERTGRTVWRPTTPFCVAEHPRIAYLRATPDRWVIEAPDMKSPGLVQIKSCNIFKAHDWDAGAPDFIQVQVQAEMAVTGRDWDSVAVLIGGSTFRSIDVERNPEFIAELEEQAKWFWSLVESRTAPPIDASQRTLDAIKRLHPLDNGDTVRLPEESIAWLAALEAAKGAAKAAEDAKTEAESQLRAAIGAATFGELPDGRRLSLKTTSNKGYTKVVEPYTYRTLRVEKAPTKARRA